ncbi:MAG: hypothetical protein ACLSUT_02925 [Christensenellales bacterium]
MQLVKPRTGARCEMGACKRRADYTIKMDRVGIKSAINVCRDCLNELYVLLGTETVPKSIETVGRRRNDGNHEEED